MNSSSVWHGSREVAECDATVQDLAPITLYTDWGLEGGVSNVWRNVQGSGGRGSDLMPPMQCREVSLCPRTLLDCQCV